MRESKSLVLPITLRGKGSFLCDQLLLVTQGNLRELLRREKCYNAFLTNFGSLTRFAAAYLPQQTSLARVLGPDRHLLC